MFIFITNTKPWPENPTLTALDPRTPAKTHHKAIMQPQNTKIIGTPNLQNGGTPGI